MTTNADGNKFKEFSLLNVLMPYGSTWNINLTAVIDGGI